MRDRYSTYCLDTAPADVYQATEESGSVRAVKVKWPNIPALSMAPLMATEPSLVAGTEARLPLKDPIGVRTALTMTTSYDHTFSVYMLLCSTED